MLGRKTYSKEEIDHCKAAFREQIEAYHALVKAAGGKSMDKKVGAALGTFETSFFNNLTLALDRYFVHRVRPVTGKDGNPLNEVEVICESLMNNNGVMRPISVIKLVPDQSVTKIPFGAEIRLTAEQFERLSDAFFADLERKFL